MKSDSTKRAEALTEVSHPDCEFLYLGYPLLLSKSEKAALCRELYGVEDADSKPFTMLISRINAKAFSISGRKLLREKERKI